MSLPFFPRFCISTCLNRHSFYAHNFQLTKRFLTATTGSENITEKHDEMDNLVLQTYKERVDSKGSEIRDELFFNRPILFDTHNLIKQLQEGGFNECQAESLCNVLLEIITVNLQHNTKNLITKSQQELLIQQVMSRMNSLQKDMIILEKSEFGALRHENDKHRIEIVELKKHIVDSLEKVKSGVQLDINLERARATEAHHKNERNLQTLDNKIDREGAQLMATFERYRNDIFKYVGGAIMTCLTIVLGFYRLWIH